MNMKMKMVVGGWLAGIFWVGAPALTLASTNTATTSVWMDSRDYPLVVASGCGSPVPAVGTNVYAWGSAVTCSVSKTADENGVAWYCTGWTGTGSIPTSGTTNTTGEVVLTHLESSITWNWETTLTRITTTSLPSGMELVPYSAQLQATNGVAPYRWSVMSDALPVGLSLSLSGEVSGTPIQIGNQPVVFWAQDAVGGITAKELVISIEANPNNWPVVSSKSPATNSVSLFVASNKIFRVFAYDPEGIDLGYDWQWDGVQVGSNRSVYTHTAAWENTGWHILRCYISDDLWQNVVYAEWEVFIGDVPLEITTTTLPGGTEMVHYSAWLAATNGAEPFSWSVEPWAPLPAGLFCATNGLVSGSPTQAGTNEVEFVVRDNAGVRTNKTLTIVIEPNANMRPVFYGRSPVSNAVSMNEATNKPFRVYAYDPEDVALTYSWTWDGAEVGVNSDRYTHTTDWGDVGWHVLRCYASDDLWANVVYAQWDVIVLDDDGNDNDGDGMPNEQEIDLGRNPNDPRDAGAPASLSGTIRGGGTGLADAYLELRGLGDTTYYQAMTDDVGAYSIGGILPGHYFFKAGAEDFADEWYNNATHRTNAMSVAIAAEATISGFDFVLESGQNPALVEVTSDPAGAAIYLDYQALPNVTPAVLNVGEVVSYGIQLGQGIASHVITLKKAGRARPISRSVVAREAETIGMHFDLTSSATGSVSVSTTPEGTSVYIDYADLADGTTPVVVGNLAPGAHVILLKKAGYLQPRPVVAQVQEGVETEIAIPLADDTASERIIADVGSVPSGARIYVDYLPTTNVTDALVNWMDWASHAGSGWHSATHTIMLRKSGFLPPSPRYVPDITNEVQALAVQLIVDSVAAVDADEDGLPDQWQDAYRLHEEAPGKSGADDDPDHDGRSNDEEMRAGTNPLDGNSTFELDAVALSVPGLGQTITFTFATVPGSMYIVQMGNDVSGAWTNLSGVILAAGYQTTYSAMVPAGSMHHFYRLVVLTP